MASPVLAPGLLRRYKLLHLALSWFVQKMLSLLRLPCLNIWAWGWNLDGQIGDGTFDGGGMYTKKWFLENLLPSNDGNKIRSMSKANPTQVIATNKKTFFNVNVT